MKALMSGKENSNNFNPMKIIIDKIVGLNDYYLKFPFFHKLRAFILRNNLDHNFIKYDLLRN